MRPRTLTLLALGATSTLAHAQFGGGGSADDPTMEFQVPIPELGQEFFFGNGIIPFSNDFHGGTVIDARLDLVLDVVDAPPGDPRISGAQHFFASILVPVDLDPVTEGAQIPAINISGMDEGWEGTGRFTISRTLDGLIGGTWYSPLFYTAVVEDVFDENHIVAGTTNPFIESFITITVQNPSIPAPGALGVLGLSAIGAARRRR